MIFKKNFVLKLIQVSLRKPKQKL